MGTSVILRWRVSDLECELEMKGGIGQISVRQHGEIVRRATVESAAVAHQWAREQADLLEGHQRRTG